MGLIYRYYVKINRLPSLGMVCECRQSPEKSHRRWNVIRRNVSAKFFNGKLEFRGWFPSIHQISECNFNLSVMRLFFSGGSHARTEVLRGPGYGWDGQPGGGGGVGVPCTLQTIANRSSPFPECSGVLFPGEAASLLELWARRIYRYIKSWLFDVINSFEVWNFNTPDKPP